MMQRINKNGPFKKHPPTFECPCCFYVLKEEENICPQCGVGIAKKNNFTKTMTENPFAKTLFSSIKRHKKYYRD